MSRPTHRKSTAKRAGPFARLAAQVLAIALLAAPAWAAEIVQIRVGNHPTFTRIVFELDRPAGYRVERQEDADSSELVVTLDAASRARSISSKSAGIRKVEVTPGDVHSVAHVGLRKPGLRVKEMILANPPRIVLDVMSDAPAVVAKPAPAATPVVAKISKPTPAPKPAVTEKPAPEPPEPIAATPPAPKLPEPIAATPPAPKLPEPIAATPPAPKLPEPIAATPTAPKLPEPIAATPPAPKPPEPIAATPPAPKPPEPIAATPPAPKPATTAKVEPLKPAATPEALAKPEVAEPREMPEIQNAKPEVGPEKPVARRPETVEPAAPKAAKVTPSAPARDEAGWMSNPIALGAAAGALLCLIGFVLLMRRRRTLPNDLDVTAIAHSASADPVAEARETLMGGSAGSAAESSFDDLFATEPEPRDTAVPATQEPAAGSGSSFDDLFDYDAEPEAAAATIGDDSMNQRISDLPADPDSARSTPPPLAPAAAPDADVLRVVHELERRMAQFEGKLEEANESRERLERQVAAQSEELRVQRAAIARTQRALRTMSRGDEDKATEPALRETDTQAKTRVTVE